MPSGAYILAIDQGTTSSRALVVDGDGEVLGIGQQPFTQHYPRPGYVEHNPEDIWETTLEAIATALAGAGVAPAELATIGIANQRETVLLWDRESGEPVSPAVVWQDRRTAAQCNDLRERGLEDVVRARTGLAIDPYFSGTKLAWLLDDTRGLRAAADAGVVAAGTIDSWLLWKLTGGKRHATDYTNASRTLLFNTATCTWDDDLLALLDVPASLLPEACPSRADFGVTDAGVLGAEIPIGGIAGDQQAALFGQAGFVNGVAKNTYGTGCFLLADIGPERLMSQNRMLVSLSAGSEDGEPGYVIEGSVFVAGALVQWLRDELGIIRRSEDIEALARTVPDAGGVTIVPAFTGLGAPDWDPYARGAILGLTRGTTKAHIARAALEAIALASTELLQAVQADLPHQVVELRADGGAARNDLLMQMQADFAGITVVRPQNIETTALGVAYLAGIQSGIWANTDEVASLWQPEGVFEPRLGIFQRRDRLAEWRRAVGRTLDWARPE
jgi:glycerol kinase